MPPLFTDLAFETNESYSLLFFADYETSRPFLDFA